MHLVGTFVGTALASAALVPVVKRLAERLGAVDQPGGGRKIHVRPIPRLGGVAVFIPVLAGAWLGLRAMGTEEGVPFFGPLELGGLLTACAIVFLIGVYDDIRGVRPFAKLGAQVAAASSLVACGISIEQISTPFALPFQLGLLDYPLTVLWLVGLSNGMNLLDGIDGLAAGVGAMGALTVFLVAVEGGAPEVPLIALALVGSLVGFLIFNFPPAKIFLGDCGALTLGFLLAALPLISRYKAATAVTLLVPIVALAIPILDTTLAIVRRTVLGRHPFAADRSHIHHRLLALGLSPRQVTLTAYGASALLMAMAVSMNNASRIGALVILLFVGGGAALAVRQLGMDEVQALWRVLRYGERRRYPPRARRVLVRSTLSLLKRASGRDELAEYLEEVRRGLQLDTLMVRFGREGTASSGLSEIVLGDPAGSPDPSEPAVSSANPQSAIRNPQSDDLWSVTIPIYLPAPNGCNNGMIPAPIPHSAFRIPHPPEATIGSLFAAKPAWKRRRASEPDEELLAEIAAVLAVWHVAHPQQGR